MGLFDDILNGAELDDASGTSEKIKKESPKKKSKAEKKEDNTSKKKEDIKADGAGGLPSGFIDILESIINDYCVKYEIEDMKKASSLQWRGACQYVGMWSKNNRIYIDEKKSKTQGGRVYDTGKIDDAITIWSFLCVTYKKTPLITDFIEFIGVSRSWFYDNNGSCQLTSASAQVVKKLSDIQAAGLASGLMDGRENPTGKIYFSKAVLGWSESGSIRPQSDQADTTSSSLPDFNNLGLPKL